MFQCSHDFLNNFLHTCVHSVFLENNLDWTGFESDTLLTITYPVLINKQKNKNKIKNTRNLITTSDVN